MKKISPNTEKYYKEVNGKRVFDRKKWFRDTAYVDLTGTIVRKNAYNSVPYDVYKEIRNKVETFTIFDSDIKAEKARQKAAGKRTDKRTLMNIIFNRNVQETFDDYMADIKRQVNATIIADDIIDIGGNYEIVDDDFSYKPTPTYKPRKIRNNNLMLGEDGLPIFEYSTTAEYKLGLNEKQQKRLYDLYKTANVLIKEVNDMAGEDLLVEFSYRLENKTGGIESVKRQVEAIEKMLNVESGLFNTLSDPRAGILPNIENKSLIQYKAKEYIAKFAEVYRNKALEQFAEMVDIDDKEFFDLYTQLVDKLLEKDPKQLLSFLKHHNSALIFSLESEKIIHGAQAIKNEIIHILEKL